MRIYYQGTFLYREKHIGQPKSIVAAEEILKVNPKLHIHALQMKVNPESESLFTDEFWKDCDVVVTALDNVQARQYVDQQCIRHKLFMIDSGTLGMKANSQVSFNSIWCNIDFSLKKTQKMYQFTGYYSLYH